jgi:hypothetical protein
VSEVMVATDQATGPVAPTKGGPTTGAGDGPLPVAPNKATTHQTFGVGMGIAVVGAMLLLVPLLLPMSGGWLTALHVLAIAISGIGASGAMMQLSKLRNRPEFQNMGVAVLLLSLAGGGLIVRVSTELPYPWLVLLVLFIVALAAVGVIGFCMALGEGMEQVGMKVPADRARPQSERPVVHERLTSKDAVTLGVALFSGVLAAATTIIAAYISKN